MNIKGQKSYQNDPSVPAFDDTHPIVIFDGECVLCSNGVQWMLARDRSGVVRFATIQSEIPRALYNHYNLDADRFDTFMVLAEGRPFLRWQGVLKAARLLPPPWRWLGQAGRIVPNVLGNRIYDFVQRHRIGWFGARDICYVPDETSKARFLT